MTTETPTPAASPSGWRTHLQNLALSALGLAIFALLVHLGGREALERVASADLAWLAASMAVTVVFMFCLSWRWGIFTDQIAGYRVTSVFDYYFYRASSTATSFIIPQTAGSVAVSIGALTRLGVPMARSMAAMLIDRLSDASFMLIFLVPALLFVFDVLSLSGFFVLSMFFFAVITAAIAIYYDRLFGAMKRLVLRVVRSVGGWLARSAGWVQRVPLLRRIKWPSGTVQAQPLAGWHAIGKPAFWQGYALTAIVQLLLVVRAWMFARAVGMEMSFFAAFMGVTIAQVGFVIAIAPGALGTVEAGWYIALAAADVPSDVIATYVLAQRVFQSLGVAVTWLVAYFVMLAHSYRDKARR